MKETSIVDLSVYTEVLCVKETSIVAFIFEVLCVKETSIIAFIFEVLCVKETSIVVLHRSTLCEGDFHRSFVLKCSV